MLAFFILVFLSGYKLPYRPDCQAANQRVVFQFRLQIVQVGFSATVLCLLTQVKENCN